MGVIKESRTLFFTTSPRSPKKLIPEIELLINNFSGKVWSEHKQVVSCCAQSFGNSDQHLDRWIIYIVLNR